MNDISFDNHFKDLFDNTSDLIHFATIEGNIEIANSAWLSTLDYELHEVVGRSIFDFIHQPCIAEYKAARKQTLERNKKTDLTTTFMSRQGKEVVVEGHIGCSFKNNEPIYSLGVFKNITARKLAEKKLEASEKRLITFFKSGPDAVIVINQKQQILEWNPKAEIIFGYKAKEVVGKTLSETIIPHQYREAHNHGMTHFLKTGEGPVLNKTIEITALHKKGHEFYISLSISNVKLEGEWIFIAFLSDITERKKTEEALIYKEAELLQAKLMEERKNEFISIASHELKTPLTTIKAYAQLALTLSKEDGIIEYLKKIDQYTGKLTTLLNELLDVSKLNDGKLKLNQQEVELSTFLTEVLNSMQQITPNHKIIFERNDISTVAIDSLRLEQVITNIICNAAKYSPGKDKILVNSVKEEDKVIISITDFGIGIPKNNFNKVFDRFYRVDEVAKEFSGLGIGLFISSEIIKQHGGKIWVESKETEGSTFYFSLPLVSN